jgi:hypothetical protein
MAQVPLRVPVAVLHLPVAPAVGMAPPHTVAMGAAKGMISA